MSQTAEFLGWINVFLVSINTLLYLTRLIYKKIGLKKTTEFWITYKKMMAVLKKVHIFSGLAVIILGLVHGVMMLGGSLYMHTGLLVWINMLFLFGIFALSKLSKTFKKIWILPHRLLAMTLWGLLILHLIKTWILS
ncbi:MAG TPA: hypothetical protein PLM73_06370 [Petrotogaceae bacterium]|jgi:hypothetical protein|nr:hypothetical protein [Petrotogaceae bacterium]HPX14940.1 hypothetical protein [Petrotogaceae bacterium]HQC40142.1 hypothetical protein [Petrotogaceae bacterium]HQF33315.1 hypothetical protein [Petrotogaceae bacterium]HQI78605.1 hypothetical protein [Petrotogaceae bacterium]